MRRLAIFLTYDSERIIDDYIIYLLEHIQKIADDIVVVSNGSLLVGEKDKLKPFCKEIFERDNKGFDAGGFKDTLCKFIGWNRIQKYEEVIFLNDSFFGPFIPLTEMFQNMAERAELDFWGVTKSSGNSDVGDILQTYFFVVRSRLLHSSIFVNYWEQLPYFRSFNETVLKYEREFALYFSSRGYVWDSYIDPNRYRNIHNNSYISPYHCLPHEIVINQRYPFIKKKIFSFDFRRHEFGLDQYGRDEILSILEFIHNSNYPEQYIWKNIIRIYGLRDIQDNCCDRVIIPDDVISYYEKRLLICVYITNSSFLIDKGKRALECAKKYDLRVYCDSEKRGTEIKQIVDGVDPIVKTNKRGYYIDLFNYLKDNYKKYDYIGIMNEHKISLSENKSYNVDSSIAWNAWENMFGRDNYIQNVIGFFEHNTRYGLLVTPRPIHGDEIFKLWEKNTICHELSKLLDVSSYAKRDKYLADYSESFWIRANVIDDKFYSVVIKYLEKNNNMRDIFRILPYYVQKTGLLTSVIQSLLGSRAQEKTMELYGRSVLRVLKKIDITKDFASFSFFVKILTLYAANEEQLKTFLRDRKRVYIYGCGHISRLISNFNFLNKLVVGYLVSKEKDANRKFCGKRVYWLSQVVFEPDDVVIIALNKKNSEEIKKIIFEKLDNSNIFWINAGE